MKNLKIKIIVIIGIIAISAFLFYKNKSNFYYQEPYTLPEKNSAVNNAIAGNNNDTNLIINIANNIAEDTKKISVSIIGGVKKPGVYKFANRPKLKELISAASGLDTSANYNAIKYDNILLEDGDTVIIPVRLQYGKYENKFVLTNEIFGNLDELLKRANLEEKKENQQKSSSVQQLININTASLEEIMTLPRVGKKTAEAIIEYRKVHGKFSSFEELTNIPGIGQKRLEALKSKITIK
ncbi:MAG TPA: helix-hairpin-helix domain-containing protein [bacterium]|nr:helix-hairpin-helix domain-containing protein [bacterium]